MALTARLYLTIPLVLVCFLAIVNSASGSLLLYEGFDVAPGSLNGKAGATSFGFDPVLGPVWESGVFGSPHVSNGSLLAPGSTATFFKAASIGNRVTEDDQSTVTGRASLVSSPHLYGSLLADIQLDGSFNTSARVNFQNFHLLAINEGGGSTNAFWHVENSGGTFNTGVNSQGQTLILWELAFDQSNSLAADTLRVWFNRNPLAELPDFESTTFDMGQNQWGGLSLNNTIFLGRSQVEFDEIRIGTDWASVGVSAVPEPASGLLFSVIFAALAVYGRRRRPARQ